MKASDRRAYIKILVAAANAAKLRNNLETLDWGPVTSGQVSENFAAFAAWHRGEMPVADLVALTGLVDLSLPLGMLPHPGHVGMDY